MKFIRKNIKIISIFIIIVLAIICLFIKIYLNNNSNLDNEVEEVIELEKDIEVIEEEEVIELVSVDIKGAIITPGVYEIEKGKKVIDVVNKAGGLTEDADTSMINLAKQVANEMVIIIYTKEEVKKYSTKEEIVKVIDKECICPKITNDACINTKEETSSSNKNDNKQNITTGKVNLNTATLEELQGLTGVGESKAQAIIDYRIENGNFKNIEDIKNVSGIGEALYEKIKDNITI